MSRREILNRLCCGERPRLFELKPVMGDDTDETPRSMYVNADILAVVTPPFPDTLEGERLGQFRAWLDDFVDGAEISVSEDPDRKPPETMLARVKPVEDEIWSIRVHEPLETAGIRSLGAFWALNEFIALTWAKREDIGADFDAEVREAQEEWIDLFETEPPHSGDDINEYLTPCYRAA
jgi:hypothetical protein